MWTISDFPAYDMLSSWMTSGKLACPYCMERTKAFRLKYGKKHTWFDCHRQLLPENHPFRSNKSAFLKIGLNIHHLLLYSKVIRYKTAYIRCLALLITMAQLMVTLSLRIGQNEAYFRNCHIEKTFSSTTT